MPRAAASKHYTSFVGGINTDSSPLNSPESTARLLQNVDLDIDGSLRRRLGLDFESGFVLSTDTFTLANIQDRDIALGEWLSVDNNIELNFYVVRIGAQLFFFNAIATSPSANLKGSLSFSSFATVAADINKDEINLSSGRGVLVVTGPSIEPFYVSFDQSAETFSTTKIDVQIRDFIGIDDSLALENRPATLSADHEYNLLNQGWKRSGITTTTGEDAIAQTFTDISVFPSNSDIMFLGKIQSSATAADIGKYSGTELKKSMIGNTAAPKGHFILNAFNKERSTVSGLAVADTVTNKRPRAATFFAGRLWLAGPDGFVYFSQILEDLTFIDRYYQEQDPTAEDFNALLATDGGAISIPEMGDGLAIVAIETGVIVLSASGIWHISGGVENFTATQFQIRNITNVGIAGPATVVVLENRIMFWSESGIYLVAPEQVSGNLQATNITDGIFQRDFACINQAAKLQASGVYDKEEKKVYWLYNKDQTTGATATTSEYDSIIVLDLTINAFYTYKIADLTISSLPVFLAGLIKSNARASGSLINNVVRGADNVIASGNQVITTTTFTSADILALKGLIFSPQAGVYKFTFGEFDSRTFKDWFTQDSTGVDYKSIIETGYEILGETMRDKQATYLFTFLSRRRGVPESDEIFTG